MDFYKSGLIYPPVLNSLYGRENEVKTCGAASGTESRERRTAGSRPAGSRYSGTRIVRIRAGLPQNMGEKARISVSSVPCALILWNTE